MYSRVSHTVTPLKSPGKPGALLKMSHSGAPSGFPGLGQSCPQQEMLGTGGGGLSLSSDSLGNFRGHGGRREEIPNEGA